MQDQYKYHLKDKEKEKRLSALCDDSNAFLKALQPEAKKLVDRERDIAYVSFGKYSDEFIALVNYSDVVKIEQYEPKTWNNFLNTTPPENDTLRLEVTRNTKQDYCTLRSTRRYCAVWDGRHFFVPDLDANCPVIRIDEKELANGTVEAHFKAWDD